MTQFLVVLVLFISTIGMLLGFRTTNVILSVLAVVAVVVYALSLTFLLFSSSILHEIENRSRKQR